MNVNDGWAAASARIIGADADLQKLPTSLLEAGEFNEARSALLLPVGTDEDASLQRLMEDVRTFFERHRPALAAVPRSCTVELFLGWSPRAPQEALTMDAGLIRALADAGASVVFDTYSD